ncbi:MAG: transporter, permease protein [Bacillales bacterium]|jgi:simple sugar transport system permease protein|nr:transporter, permease protein [Bacillales bacterium]
MYLFKLIKRDQVSSVQHTFILVIAIIFAFGLSSLLLLLTNASPFQAFYNLLVEPFQYRSGPIEIIKLTTSLTVISLGISFAFKMKFWNIGAEGQILLGSVGAMFVARSFPTLPAGGLLPLMLVGSFIFGASWGVLPAFFKAKFGTNETLFTLMMNYIALNIVKTLESGPWKDPKSFQNTIAALPDNARIPSIFTEIPWSLLNAGFIIAIILTLFSFYYMKHTKSGYELSVVGESESTARYAGMHVFAIVIRTMIISAGICGIAGFIQVAGNNSTLSSGVAGGLGFTAIITTWLSKLNMFMIPVVSLVFAIIAIGKDGLITIGIPSAAADAIQGIILFCILGCEFFLRYKIRLVKKSERNVSEVRGAA